MSCQRQGKKTLEAEQDINYDAMQEVVQGCHGINCIFGGCGLNVGSVAM